MAATDQFQFFCRRKKLSRKLFKFYYDIPYDMEMCMCFFKVLPKFKMAAMHELLWAQKPKIKVRNNV